MRLIPAGKHRVSLELVNKRIAKAARTEDNSGGADRFPPQQLADTMHAAWVAFATTGDCGWPKHDLSRRATMRFERPYGGQA